MENKSASSVEWAYSPTLKSSLASLRVLVSCLVDSSEPFIFQLPPTKKVRAILAMFKDADRKGERVVYVSVLVEKKAMRLGSIRLFVVAQPGKTHETWSVSDFNREFF